MFKCAADFDKMIDTWNATPATSGRVPILVARAVLVVFNNQIESEKKAAQTKITNGVGFSQADARTGTYTAKRYLANGEIHPIHLKKWLKKNKRGNYRISKYWKQLNEAAEKKANATNA